MTSTIESKCLEIELLREVSREYYFQSLHNPCRMVRGRAGWDLLKNVKTIRQSQKEYVSLCDQTMSRAELYLFLKNQSLNLNLS